MIESWDDALTLKQIAELQTASVEALISLEYACYNNEVQVRLEIAYIDGKRLCFYPPSIDKDFFEENFSLVVEENFGRTDAKLFPIGGDCSTHSYSWAVEEFRLTPKFLRELANKLHEKVSE